MIVALAVTAPLALSVGCVVYASMLEAAPGRPRRSVLSRRNYYTRGAIAFVALVVGVVSALAMGVLLVIEELS